MQDKNVKLPFMYQSSVPNITKFANLGFIQKNFSLVSKKLGTDVLLKREKQK